MKENDNVIGIVGAGHIFLVYLEALKSVFGLRLKSVFDKAGKPQDMTDCENVVFNNSYEEMLKDNEINTVVVAVPPVAHFEVALKALEAGKNVVLEKPPTANLQQFQALKKLAEEKGVSLIPIFHATHCMALKSLLEDIEITERGTLHKKFGWLISVCAEFYDPHVIDGKLKEGVSLGDSWIDSGPNALSVILKLVKDVNVIYAKPYAPMYDEHGNCDPVVRCNVSFTFLGGSGSILTNWQNNQNLKKTTLHFEYGSVVIHHSKESILDGEYAVIKDLHNDRSRWTNHYVGVFKDVVECLGDRTNARDNLEKAEKIMRVIDEVYSYNE